MLKELLDAMAKRRIRHLEDLHGEALCRLRSREAQIEDLHEDLAYLKKKNQTLEDELDKYKRIYSEQ